MISPVPRNHSRGSALLLVLLVLAGLVVIVGGLQYLAHGTLRQTRLTLADAVIAQRADGVLKSYLCRWKKGVAYQTETSPDFPSSRSETGRWDGLDFEIGWEREDRNTHPETYRQTVWIRFPDVPPVKTHRYELLIRVPSALKPRAFEMVSLDVDDVDPTDDAARDATFDGTRLDNEERASREARAQVLGTAVYEAALAGSTPEDILGSINGQTLGAAIEGMETVVEASIRYSEQSRIPDRLTTAREIITAAAGISGTVGEAWQDLGHYLTARTQMRQAGDLSGPAHNNVLAQAIGNLDQARGGQGCCGAPLAAWLKAQITMLMRGDWSDPGALASARVSARRALADEVRRAPEEPIHEGTDIERRELLDFLARLWTARIAFGTKLADGSYILGSIRHDGRFPVIHQEAGSPIKPMAWTPDGGRIVSIVGGSGWGQKAWSLLTDGTDMQRLLGDFPDTSGQENADVKFRDIVGLEFSPDGTRVAATGTVMDVDRDYPVDVSSESVYRDLTEAEPHRYGHQSYVATSSEDDPEFIEHFSEVYDDTQRVYSRNATSPVFSPDGSSLMRIRPIGGFRGTGYVSGDQLSIEAVPVVDPEGNPYPPTGNAVGTIPIPDAESLVTGLSWKRMGTQDWAAFSVLPTTGSGNATVYFHATAGASQPLTPVTVPYQGTAHEDPRVYGGHSKAAPVGALTAAPPGYLLAESSTLQYVPLPGSGTPPTRFQPTAGGPLRDIKSLATPPWGEMAFFTARSGDGARKLYSYDLATGSTTILVGEGGAFPTPHDVGNISVAPLPD